MHAAVHAAGLVVGIAVGIGTVVVVELGRLSAGHRRGRLGHGGHAGDQDTAGAGLRRWVRRRRGELQAGPTAPRVQRVRAVHQLVVVVVMVMVVVRVGVGVRVVHGMVVSLKHTTKPTLDGLSD